METIKLGKKLRILQDILRDRSYYTMIKNFSKQPNDFLLDEKKEHKITGLLKNSTEKLIFIVMQGCQSKYGTGFQKSEKQLSEMCLISRSTFQKNINEMEAKGLVSRQAINKAGTKEKETTKWFVNMPYEFELSTTLPENEATLIENEAGVALKSGEGSPKIGQKKDVLRSLKDLSNSNIYKPRELHLINTYLESKEIAYMKDFLMNKGFGRGIIEEIAQSVAIKVMQKAFALYFIGKDKILNIVVQKYNSDVNNPNAKFFLYKLEKEIELFNLKKVENDEKIREYEEATE